jgi:hypothetical protein
MIVAVIAMMTMQASLVDVIQVIAVRDPRMVPVLGGLAIVKMPLMLGAPMLRRAAIGVLLADLDAMGFNAVFPLMFQAIVSQVIHVVTVTHGRMSAAGAVSMCHCRLLSSLRVTPAFVLEPLVVLSVVNVERRRPWHGLMLSSAARGVTGVQPASCIPSGRIGGQKDGPPTTRNQTEVDSRPDGCGKFGTFARNIPESR